MSDSKKLDYSLLGGLPSTLKIEGRDGKVYEINDDIPLPLLGQIVNWRDVYTVAMNAAGEMADEDELYKLSGLVLGVDASEARTLGNTACIGLLGFLVSRQAEKHLAMRASRPLSESVSPLKEPSA